MQPDPYDTCLGHGGISQLFWGLRLKKNETALRWCPEGAHLVAIAWLSRQFITLYLLN